MIVVVDRGIQNFHEAVNVVEGLSEVDFTYVYPEEITNDLLKNVEVLFIRSTTKINSSLLRDTNIKLIGSATAGSDHIDSKYLDKKNIKWFYAPGCNSSSVVHYVLSSLSALIDKNLFNHNDSVGILGCGHVGSKLRYALNALHIKNSCYDPFLSMDFLASLEEVKECKLLSLHIPLTDSRKFPTRGIINRDFLKDFKDKILINTSRGEVVDEDALIETEKLLLVSDVWNNEPTPSKEIIDFSFISTAHIAGHSYEGKLNGTLLLLNRLFEYLNLSSDAQVRNAKQLKDYFSVNLIKNYPIEIKDYAKSFNLMEESTKFKESCKDYKKSVPSEIFKSLRANHIERKDLTP
jgi:erythronate-4-phosphate dehydrogenase